MLYRILICSLLSFLLSGCIAGAFVAGGAATGAIITEPRTLTTIKDDETVNYQVNRAVMNDPVMVSQAHIIATSYNRVVLLTGQAPTQAIRLRAAQFAQKIPNVKRVFNQIVLGIPTTPLQRSKDAAITANVKARMLAERNLPSNRFKIVTENGNVFILGLATRLQADQAVAVVRHSAGVEQVTRLIETIEN